MLRNHEHHVHLSLVHQTHFIWKQLFIILTRRPHFCLYNQKRSKPTQNMSDTMEIQRWSRFWCQLQGLATVHLPEKGGERCLDHGEEGPRHEISKLEKPNSYSIYSFNILYLSYSVCTSIGTQTHDQETKQWIFTCNVDYPLSKGLSFHWCNFLRALIFKNCCPLFEPFKPDVTFSCILLLTTFPAKFTNILMISIQFGMETYHPSSYYVLFHVLLHVFSICSCHLYSLKESPNPKTARDVSWENFHWKQYSKQASHQILHGSQKGLIIVNRFSSIWGIWLLCCYIFALISFQVISFWFKPI